MTEAELIAEHMPLARQIARRLKTGLPRHVDQDEIESDAMLGLVKAARSWSPAKASFKTYANQRIAGQIIDGLRERQWVKRRALSRLGDSAPRQEQMPPKPDAQEDKGFLHNADPTRSAEQADSVREITRHLSREQRFAVLSSVVHGLTFGDVGRAIGISESRAFQVTHDGLARCRARLTGPLAPRL